MAHLGGRRNDGDGHASELLRNDGEGAKVRYDTEAEARAGG